MRTEKFVREREAQRALVGQSPWYFRGIKQLTYRLVGKYRNKYTDAVEFKVRSTANTNVVHFNGQLLALKEDSPPYALDPISLETKGSLQFPGTAA